MLTCGVRGCGKKFRTRPALMRHKHAAHRTYRAAARKAARVRERAFAFRPGQRVQARIRCPITGKVAWRPAVVTTRTRGRARNYYGLITPAGRFVGAMPERWIRRAR